MTHAKHSRFLEAILPNLKLDFIGPEIRAIYGAQIGHFVLSRFGLGQEDNDRDSPLTLEQINKAQHASDADLSGQIETELLTAIKNNPHAFGLPETLPKIDAYSSYYDRHSFQFDKALCFSIKVPKSKKKFGFVEDQIEQFEIVMTGSNYAAYVEVADCPSYMFVGQEIREQMRELLEQPNNKLRLGQIGPSPIHPRFYVVDIANENFTQLEVHTYKEDVYVFINLKIAGVSAADVYEDILDDVWVELDAFYSLKKTTSLLFDLHTALLNKLEEAVESYKKLGGNLLFVNFKRLSDIRIELLELHTANLEFELQTHTLEKSRTSFLNLLEDNMYLKGLDKYFKGMTEREMLASDALIKTLEYLEKSISSADVAIRTIFAAVFGASIGAIVTLLVKL